MLRERNGWSIFNWLMIGAKWQAFVNMALEQIFRFYESASLEIE
jgi:hypothetical protein